MSKPGWKSAELNNHCGIEKIYFKQTPFGEMRVVEIVRGLIYKVTGGAHWLWYKEFNSLEEAQEDCENILQLKIEECLNKTPARVSVFAGVCRPQTSAIQLACTTLEDAQSTYADYYVEYVWEGDVLVETKIHNPTK